MFTMYFRRYLLIVETYSPMKASWLLEDLYYGLTFE